MEKDYSVLRKTSSMNHSGSATEFLFISSVNHIAIPCKRIHFLSSDAALKISKSSSHGSVEFGSDNVINEGLNKSSLSPSEEEISQHECILVSEHVSSPTEFLNIQQYNYRKTPELRKDVNLSGLDHSRIRNESENGPSCDSTLARFCDSPLMPNSNNKDISLDCDCENQVQMSDEMAKSTEFSESEISDDFFASSSVLEQHTHTDELVISSVEQIEINLRQKKCTCSTMKGDNDENETCKFCIDKSEEVSLTENLSSEHRSSEEQLFENDYLDEKSKNGISLSCAYTAKKLSFSATSIITSSSSVTVSSVEERENIKNENCENDKSLDISLTAVDVGLLSLLPVESLVNNITLLPQSSPIKFEVIQGDGSIKCVSVKTVSKNEVKEPNSAQISEEDDEETSPFVAEIITSDAVKRFRCELCSSTFNRLGNYTRHKKIHTLSTKEDQRFHCEICGKKFIQRCDLTRHMHIHDGTEPHRCLLCGKGYLRHSDLLTHQRFHNKEKPFSCSHCTRSFSQKGDLNRHLRSIHFQVKPLTCGHCQKKFAKEATLIRHMHVSHADIMLQTITSSGTTLKI